MSIIASNSNGANSAAHGQLEEFQREGPLGASFLPKVPGVPEALESLGLQEAVGAPDPLI